MLRSLWPGLLLTPCFVHAQPGQPQAPLLDCGQQGNVEVVCGTRAPEDFEVTPDGNHLVVAKFGRGEDQALDLFNLQTQQFSALPMSALKLPGWGDPACTESLGSRVGAHGLSLSRRGSGEWQLYVVNHLERESMEMYELLPDGAAWQLVWHGCVFADKPYNDVAALADGGFVATRPQAIQQEGQNLFDGGPSGNVAIWSPGSGEQVLPGSDYAYPNGVLVSADGAFVYISGWTSSTFHRYDLRQQRETGRIELGFMPDNLTWTPRGSILAAGIKGVGGNCPADSGVPCIQSAMVAEVDPQTLQMTLVFDSGGQALISGTSVAIEATGSIYIGSFQGNRLIRVPR
jgi:DNA-binding beta-propeller fold protein YncE